MKREIHTYMNDSNNKKIEEGQTVAFNYSGSVIFGKIRRIGKCSRYHRCNIEIDHLDRNQTSKIRNTNSICILPINLPRVWLGEI